MSDNTLVGHTYFEIHFRLEPPPAGPQEPKMPRILLVGRDRFVA